MSELDIHTADLVKSYVEAKPRKEFKSWRASSIGGCPRAHYFKRLGIKETIPTDDITNRKFEAGNIFHDFLEGITVEEVEKRGGTVYREKTLYDKNLDVGGRYDLLIEIDGFRQLRDIKSQHSGLFHRLRNAAGILGDDDKDTRIRKMQEAFWRNYPNQVKQLVTYMILLEEAGQAVDEGVIVRVSKDDLSLAEVHYNLTPELKKLVLDEIGVLNKCWADKILPPCNCSTLYNGKGTHYCNFGDPESEEMVLLEGKKKKERLRTKCCDESLAKGVK